MHCVLLLLLFFLVNYKKKNGPTSEVPRQYALRLPPFLRYYIYVICVITSVKREPVLYVLCAN